MLDFQKSYAIIEQLINCSIKEVPVEEDIFVKNAVETLKSLADETRLRILVKLTEGRLKSGDIAKELSMSTSAISHQLRVLKSVNLVSSKRNGKNIVYFLSDDHVKYIIQVLKDHIMEERK
jgi:DNA-binding transcriptional ArsR family regulator